ncbi:hypothetical protein [Actinophytocola algeriensis]|uniref:Uncharacterized protein n=1 Tax=Actinophytocola algeriensis TaxID=1768010 RepID=A0A7W7VCP5_9PSEU|nr:hypothetical protein [Actinophytocola algeriensis]MBB4905341.1 hypothetical protein [Actinophytocola algeriensis]MBE1472974.1 hypothetical protein [Actinophytocola algeriensis]
MNERHYRKLLAWYPRDHRERHEDEMLGVLLAGSGPSGKETVDLLRGALRLHLRRMVGMDGGIDHRDVLAIVSLLGPIVMLAGAATVLDRLVAGSSVWRLSTAILEFPGAPVWAIWGVVAVLSLFRKRRAAAVGAWLGTPAFLAAAVLGYPLFWDSVVVTTGWMLLGVLVAVALTWSPGPARGWELVGGRRIVVLVAAVGTSVVLVMKSLGTYGVLFHPMDITTAQHGPVRMTLWALALAVLATGVVVAGGARTREGRRAALVLSVPVVVSLLMLVLPSNANLLVATAVCTAVPLVALLGSGSLPRRIRLG